MKGTVIYKASYPKEPSIRKRLLLIALLPSIVGCSCIILMIIPTFFK